MKFDVDFLTNGQIMFVYNAKFAYLLTVVYIGRVFVSDITVCFVCFSLLSLLLLLLLLLLS